MSILGINLTLAILIAATIVMSCIARRTANELLARIAFLVTLAAPKLIQLSADPAHQWTIEQYLIYYVLVVASATWHIWRIATLPTESIMSDAFEAKYKHISCPIALTSDVLLLIVTIGRYVLTTLK